MEFHFLCPTCGQKLKAEQEHAGQRVDCPDCGVEFRVPQPGPEPGPATVLPTEPPRDSAFASPNLAGELTCPVCWLRFDTENIMHLAVHDSLRGDPVLGEDAQQRFLATRFNNAGQALDALGLPTSELACPHCRRKLPPSFLGLPHHIISLVGDQSAGKSYFLSVLTKVLPATLYRDFGVTFQDSDPTGNAPVNDMRKALFGAQTPAQAKLAKTVFEGAMYERLPRQGRMVALPWPFVHTLTPEDKPHEQCAFHGQGRRLPARVGGSRLLAGTARRGWDCSGGEVPTPARRMRRTDRHLRHDHQTLQSADLIGLLPSPVLANPPFNVNAVDKERLKDMVRPGRRFPFGLPRTDNANYLWIQLIHSALNEKGRAGFVMANGARNGHSCSIKVTEDVRKYAVELGIAEEAFKRGVEEKSKEFVESGAEVCAKA